MVKLFLKTASLFLVVLISGLLMISCEKEIVEVGVEENYVNESIAGMQENGKFGKSSCFEVVFPIAVEFPDGTTQSSESYEDLRTIIIDWRKNNSNVTGHPTLVFPIEVINKEGAAITVADNTELKDLATACGIGGNRGWKGIRGFGGTRNPCFEVVFPVSIEFPDGSTRSIAAFADFRTLLEDWKTNGTDMEGRPTIVYPITVRKDGEEVTIADEAAWRALKEDCVGDFGGFGNRGDRCFEVVFPVSIELPDGSTQAIDSFPDFRTLLMDWRRNNSNTEGRPTIVLPITVIKDGEEMTIADSAAWKALMEDCFSGFGGMGNWGGPTGNQGGFGGIGNWGGPKGNNGGFGGTGSWGGPKGNHGGFGGKGDWEGPRGNRGDRCFDLVFPVSVDYPDGTNATYEEATDFQEAMRNWQFNNRNTRDFPTLVFPITVAFEDGSTETIENGTALRELKETCSEGD